MKDIKRALTIILMAAMLFSFCSAGAENTIGITTGVLGDGGDNAGPLEGLVIGVDPGHQAKGNYEKEPVAPGSSEKKAKVSSGTAGTVSGVAEHEVNLQVALKLKELLALQGCTVIMVRETADVDISNIQRAQMMNEAEADLVLRLHCNGASSKKASGMEIYVRKTGEKAKESKEAAQCILEAMLEKTGAKNRGVARSDNYSGLNWSSVPSMLIEMGFLTNPQEEALLISDDYQLLLAQGMVEGVIDYFSALQHSDLSLPQQKIEIGE